MPLQKLSPEPEVFLQTVSQACEPLFYLSETEKPVRAHLLVGSGRLSSFCPEDLLAHFFPNQPDLPVDSADMHLPGAEGYQLFFRHFADKMIQSADGTFSVRYPEELDQVEKWRVLRDLWMDHCIHQQFFRVHLPNLPEKAIFSVAQWLQVELDPDTNEMKLQPGDWLVLETGTIET